MEVGNEQLVTVEEYCLHQKFFKMNKLWEMFGNKLCEAQSKGTNCGNRLWKQLREQITHEQVVREELFINKYCEKLFLNNFCGTSSWGKSCGHMYCVIQFLLELVFLE